MQFDALLKEFKQQMKDELRAELVAEIKEEIEKTQKCENQQCYKIIKDLVNKRFTRVDKNAARNNEVVRAFVAMIKDAFALAKIYELDEESGEKAIAMTREIIAVCDKYTKQN